MAGGVSTEDSGTVAPQGLLFGDASGYAFSISLRDSTRSIKGRMPSSLDLTRDSSSRDMTLAGLNLAPTPKSAGSSLLSAPPTGAGRKCPQELYNGVGVELLVA